MIDKLIILLIVAGHIYIYPNHYLDVARVWHLVLGSIPFQITRSII